MNEMIKNLGKSMAALVRVVNIENVAWAKDERRFFESRKLNKFDHELRGMVRSIKAMGLEFDFHYDDEVVKIVAIEIAGVRFDI